MEGSFLIAFLDKSKTFGSTLKFIDHYLLMSTCRTLPLSHKLRENEAKQKKKISEKMSEQTATEILKRLERIEAILDATLEKQPIGRDEIEPRPFPPNAIDPEYLAAYDQRRQPKTPYG
jgi:hypothetical protein